MKRREFFIKLSAFSFASVFGLFSWIKPSFFKPMAVNNGKGTIILPTDPEVYSSIHGIEVKNSELPLRIVTADQFGDGTKELLITKAGKYTFQYLGDHYGWMVV